MKIFHSKIERRKKMKKQLKNKKVEQEIHYWYLNVAAVPLHDTYLGHSKLVDVLKRAGNYYPTRAKARLAAARVKKAYAGK